MRSVRKKNVAIPSGVPLGGYRVRAVLSAVGLLLAILLLLAGSPTAAAQAPGPAAAYDQEELAFFELLNDYRAEHGRAPLLLADRLSLTAERHASDMAKYGFFSHETEQSDFYPVGSHSWDRLRLDGYSGAHTCGENLAAGMAEAERALEAWRNSPSHNSNMLDPGSGNSRTEWRVVGVARVQNAEGIWYWATEFGTTVESEVYEGAARRLSTLGILDGYANGSLGLADPVLRQQFAKLIVRGLGLTPTEADTCPFPDVGRSAPGGLYPDKYVAVAHERGIARGRNDGRFGPWEHVSRAQVITMTVRAIQTQAPGSLAAPPAGYGSPWGAFSSAHQDYVALAQYNGLLNGLSLNQESPWAAMPRGEVARLLDNLSRLN